MALTDAGRARLSALCKARNPRLGRGLVAPVFVRDGVAGKVCVGCLVWFSLERFALHASCAGGRRSICTTCEGQRAYAANPQRVIAAVRAYQKRNPEKVRMQKRASDRRRHKKKMHGAGVSIAEYRAVFAMYGGLCAYCGVKEADTLDHVIPLAKGGEHDVTNVVPACRSCNFAKHTEVWRPRSPQTENAP